jgi:LuxR family transcriptional regulator, maltose regulon positive regulatory protein
MATRQWNHAAGATLTRAQVAVLRHVARGLTNAEVARKMSITVGTTKWHLHGIFQRLGVRNRTAAVARARQLGLL